MAYTVDQLSAVESAIASGTLTVRIGDRMITYQSLPDLIRLRDLMRAEVQAASGVRTRSKVWRPVTSTGL